MEWGKAKNILIVLFLLVNIFLGINLVYEKFMPIFLSAQTGEAEDILRSRGVVLECSIPKTQGSSKRLLFEAKVSFDGDKVISKLLGKAMVNAMNNVGRTLGDENVSIQIENPYSFTYINKSPAATVNINDRKDIEKKSLQFIKDSGFTTRDLKLDTHSEVNASLKELVYIQKKGSLKQFGSRVVIQIGANGVQQLKCSLPIPTGEKKDPENLIPAYKMLLQNFLKDSNIVITSIELGYNINDEIDEMKSFSEKMFWRVRFKDGKDRYFDAITGLPKNGQ